MGHTNETPNYNLPQFVGTDKPTFLGDINGAFLAIDTAIADVASDTAGAVSVANGAATLAQSASGAASAASTTATEAATSAATAVSTATTAADTANNAQSTAVLAKSTADSAAASAATATTTANAAYAAAVRGSVSVSGDGVKTWAVLLAELYALVDRTKITPQSALTRGATEANVSQLVNRSSAFLAYASAYCGGSSVTINTFNLTDGKYYTTSITASGTTFTDNSSNVVDSGFVIAVYY